MKKVNHRKSATLDTLNEIWESDIENISNSYLNLEQKDSNYFLSLHGDSFPDKNEKNIDFRLPR